MKKRPLYFYLKITLLLGLSLNLAACATKLRHLPLTPSQPYNYNIPDNINISDFVDDFEVGSVEFGKAVSINQKFQGKPTTSGEIYDMSDLVAAHGSLPFGICAKVTNLKNGKFVVVRINERRVPKKGRIVELSFKAAEQVGIFAKDSEEVKVEVIKSQIGYASWYGPGYHGNPTSSKEIYNMNDLTAAHRLLPFQTLIKVTNLDNGRFVIVRINDRGPWVKDRVIDLSKEAAMRIGMIGVGSVKVKLEVVL